MKKQLGMALLLASMVACATTSAAPEAKVKSEKGMSPGPAGKLEGQDFRVELTWIYGADTYGAGNYGRKMEFQELDRFYEIHVPPSYKPGTPMPLVMVLHGGGGNPSVVRFQSSMSEVADRNNFIVVYPAGTGTMFNDRFLYWNSGPKSKNKRQQSVNDVAFLAAVLDDVAKFFSIDTKRVYSTGISNGGQMSFRIGSELYNRIAAIAPVEGHRIPGEFFQGPPGPLPVIMFHGKQDTYIPFDGGTSPDTSNFEACAMKPAPEVAQIWAKHNGCDTANPTVVKREKASITTYKCAPAGEVIFWALEDGGHTWPGGRASQAELTGKLGIFKTKPAGPLSQAAAASAIAWDFFKRHSLDERALKKP